MRFHSLLLGALLIVSACVPRTDPNQQMNQAIAQAVAATLASIPSPTPHPIPTPYPSPTAFDLRGLFCEYQFCVGHPIDMPFFDVGAQQNTPSTYTQGIIAAFNANLFIQLIWQISPGTADPQFLLNLILDEGQDTPLGTPEVKLVRDMNVVYTPITSIASPILPFGGAGAWTCGERVFAWKTYTPDEGSAAGLFESALGRFNCNR